MPEQRIYQPIVFRFPSPYHQNASPVPCELFHHAMRTKKVGDTVTAFASAPGTGSVSHRITRMDKTGIYGELVSNTTRILDPSEIY